MAFGAPRDEAGSARPKPSGPQYGPELQVFPAAIRDQWWAEAAAAPAAAPRANHFAARARRRRVPPPFVTRMASLRSWVRVADLVRSSAKSDWAAARLAW